MNEKEMRLLETIKNAMRTMSEYDKERGSVNPPLFLSVPFLKFPCQDV